jgi:hypothetical protein
MVLYDKTLPIVLVEAVEMCENRPLFINILKDLLHLTPEIGIGYHSLSEPIVAYW